VKNVAVTSATAVADNTRTMKALYKTLSDKGVKKEGVQTVEFTVGENYKVVYEKDEDGKKQPKRVKDGFVVHNVVHVTVCDLEKFGEVLDAVAVDGANEISSISFGSSKAKDKLEQARAEAVKDALRKAKVLTSGLGVGLGRVLTVSEGEVYRPRPVAYGAMLAASVEGMRDAVPVSGGSLTYSVTVSVTWELVEVQKKPKITCGGCEDCGCEKKWEAWRKWVNRNVPEGSRKYTHPPALKLGKDGVKEPKDNK
jgi:uncharacterized protein YggE